MPNFVIEDFAFLADDLFDGQTVFKRESKIAFVMSRNAITAPSP